MKVLAVLCAAIFAAFAVASPVQGVEKRQCDPRPGGDCYDSRPGGPEGIPHCNGDPVCHLPLLVEITRIYRLTEMRRG